MFLSLFPIPFNEHCLFSRSFLYFSGKNEHSFRLQNCFFLQEIIFERMWLSEIIKSSILLFFLFRMPRHMFCNPVGFSLNKGINNILWNRKRSTDNESASLGNLNRNRTPRCSYNLKWRGILVISASYGFRAINQGKLFSFFLDTELCFVFCSFLIFMILFRQ